MHSAAEDAVHGFVHALLHFSAAFLGHDWVVVLLPVTGHVFSAAMAAAIGHPLTEFIAVFVGHCFAAD